ncbi:MAG TPA: serine/threonine-protein kinase [Pedococcus sp.]|nr:serine/threonine-protein kinase [Pedococcus sp.]
MTTSGELLNDRYRLDELIASGGMGQVWRATDELLGRLVAIKLVQEGGPAHAPAGTGADDFRERFRHEARNSAGLSHPNIATVYDFGDDANRPYLVMELVEGQSLAQLLAERGPLPPHEVTAILGQAALALQAAHTAGVVHRDVKPANIMVTPGGLVKLTDFGIARAAAGSGLTRTGEVLGTPHYLSPEQAHGLPATAASDVYALGVVGHELLTGQRPFTGDSIVATALAHVTQATPELPDSVPPTLRDAIMAALAKDPADRPESAAELAAMLGMPSGRHNPERGLDAVADAAGATMLVPAPVADPGVPAARRSRLRRWWLLPVAALAVTVVGILAAASFSSGSGSPTTHSTNTSTSTTSTTNAAAANAGANVGGAATTTPTTPTTSTTTPAAARTTAPAPAPPAPAAPVHGGRKGKKK